MAVRLGYDAPLLAAVAGRLARAVMQDMRRGVKQQHGLASVASLHAGVVTVVQRFRSDLGLYVHLHCLVTDGSSSVSKSVSLVIIGPFIRTSARESTLRLHRALARPGVQIAGHCARRPRRPPRPPQGLSSSMREFGGEGEYGAVRWAAAGPPPARAHRPRPRRK